MRYVSISTCAFFPFFFWQILWSMMVVARETRGPRFERVASAVRDFSALDVFCDHGGDWGKVLAHLAAALLRAG